MVKSHVGSITLSSSFHVHNLGFNPHSSLVVRKAKFKLWMQK